MMSAYVRVTTDGHNTRINMFNPAPVTQRVVIQLFTMDGTLVVKDVKWDALAADAGWHIELDEYLAEHGVPLPFEGNMWIGATPTSGRIFMGLQGINFDWHGAGHLASVHSMRDFGNSGLAHPPDTMWSDLILPKFVTGTRHVTKVAIQNVSADGVSEALNAIPEVILRADDGTELARKTLDPLAPYCSVLVDVRDVLGAASADIGTIQILEPNCGLVAYGFVFDLENNGIVTADHFFDRHFVSDGVGFTG